MSHITRYLRVCGLNTGKTHFIPDKPVHQLWYDDTTYMATRQYFDGKRIEMETSRIQRFSMDGETLETLGGVGNHIDGSKNRQWLWGIGVSRLSADVLLYKRGEIVPTAVLGSSDEQYTIWDLKVHPQSHLFQNGKRVYFNHPISRTKTEAVYADVSQWVSKRNIEREVCHGQLSGFQAAGGHLPSP